MGLCKSAHGAAACCEGEARHWVGSWYLLGGTGVVERNWCAARVRETGGEGCDVLGVGWRLR
jgi:hypothetical protein